MCLQACIGQLLITIVRYGCRCAQHQLVNTAAPGDDAFITRRKRANEAQQCAVAALALVFLLVPTIDSVVVRAASKKGRKQQLRRVGAVATGSADNTDRLHDHIGYRLRIGNHDHV
ncbi:MAG: hypothetical protein JWM45_796 [Pseudonocardiales bacterium]|nr:hypothetical protein [Pseudonocardiales bacterium]